jgi:hypothetical protein
MSDNFSDDYQTVAERIAIFRSKYPSGCLRPADVNHPFRLLTVDDVTYVCVTAAAYRHPEDPAPGIGQAWEAIPGATQYSRGSELMVAETSAWGRAIIAVLAADSKRIASNDEVRAAQERRAAAPPQPAAAPAPAAAAPAPTLPAPAPAPAAPAQTLPAPAIPSEADGNKGLIESLYNNVLNNPEASLQDVREAWTVLSQAGLLAWRVPPLYGMPYDGDGKVTIGSLAVYIGKLKDPVPA